MKALMKRRNTREHGRYRFLSFAILISVGAVIAGCAENGAVEITGGDQQLANEGSAAYLDRISSMKTISENQAFHGILLLMNSEDPHGTFESRVKELLSRDIARRSWDFSADRPLRRGRMAYLVCRLCGIEGGVVMRLVGPNERYCLRELKYKGIVRNSSPSGIVSGFEFAAVLARADTYMNEGGPAK